jgi:hypothetical protein
MTPWDCPACGTHNGAYQTACAMCGTPPTQGPPPPVPYQPTPQAPYPSAPYPPAQYQPAPAAPETPSWPADDRSWLTVDAPPGQPGQPPMAGPPLPEQPYPQRSTRTLTIVSIVAAVVVVGLAIAAVRPVTRWLNRSNAAPVAGPTTRSPAPVDPSPSPTPPPPEPTPSPQATSVGVVTIGASVTDPAAVDVATVLDDYFSGIDQHDYPRALGAIDPNGFVHTNDPNAVASFKRGLATSNDTDVVLLSVGPDSTGRGVLQARVTFQSTQGAGYGPKGSENETCTRWDITYVLSRPGGSAYQILSAATATHAPC